MAAPIPSSMRALTIAKYGQPSEYEVITVPTPVLQKPDEVLIKVHAASINPVDVKLASGIAKMMVKAEFPYKIGFDVSGVVASVGASVSNFAPGDEVYARVPAEYRGTVAEYVISPISTLAKKPKSLDFVEAASVPLAAQTALQSLEVAEKFFPGGLKGKTVFIPAGLSGTGLFGLQLAKNCFGVGKLITTVSTSKVPKLKELFAEGLVDQVVDYTKEDVHKAIGKGTVDFMFDTAAQTVPGLPLMKKDSLIVSISTLPSGTVVRATMPDAPFYVSGLLDVAHWCMSSWTGFKGVTYQWLSLVSKAEDLERLTAWVEEGKVKPIVGSHVQLSDIDGVRKGCQQVYDAKGGLGKFVIVID